MEVVLAILGILAVAAFATLKRAGSHERLVVYHAGQAQKVLMPGWHVVLPFIQMSRNVDVSVKTVTLRVVSMPGYANLASLSLTYCVDDPLKAVACAGDWQEATVQAVDKAATSVLSASTVWECLKEFHWVERRVLQSANAATAEWGVKVSAVSLAGLKLPYLLLSMVAHTPTLLAGQLSGATVSNAQKQTAHPTTESDESSVDAAAVDYKFGI